MTKRRKTLKQRHTIRWFLPGMPKSVSVQVPMSDASQNVILHREAVDLRKGLRGKAIECMNAQCGLRLREAFPHDVFMIEFTDTRAFAVDKIDSNGMPAHCVRYYHHEGDEQRIFDKPGGVQKLIKSGKANKTFTLYAPTKSVRHVTNINPRRRTENGRASARKGSYARIIRSGILGKQPSLPSN